ncbi:hypothetical protein U0070_005808, partial [Myodes glareolus]
MKPCLQQLSCRTVKAGGCDSSSVGLALLVKEMTLKSTIVHKYQPDKKYPKMNRSHRFPTVDAAGCADRKLLGTAGTYFLTAYSHCNCGRKEFLLPCGWLGSTLSIGPVQIRRGSYLLARKSRSPRCILWMMSRQSLNTLRMFSVSTAQVGGPGKSNAADPRAINPTLGPLSREAGIAGHPAGPTSVGTRAIPLVTSAWQEDSVTYIQADDTTLPQALQLSGSSAHTVFRLSFSAAHQMDPGLYLPPSCSVLSFLGAVSPCGRLLAMYSLKVHFVHLESCLKDSRSQHSASEEVLGQEERRKSSKVRNGCFVTGMGDEAPSLAKLVGKGTAMLIQNQKATTFPRP